MIEQQQELERRRARLFESIRSAIFIIGTGGICIVAFRNTVTWHAQRIWGASGDFWQAQWQRVYNYVDGDEWTIGVYYQFIVPNTFFWVLNSIFLLIDWYQWPTFLLKYKIQGDQTAEHGKILKACGRALYNQLVVTLPLVVLVYHLMKWRGCSFGAELPTFQWVAWEIFVFIWVEEIGFYYSHRLCHHPALYKHIHKIHHEWTAPIGVTSIYCHPLEMLVCNLLPIVLGPIICGSHIGTSILWFLLAIFSTTIAHSGYHLPFLPSPEAHDFHHLKFSNCFGVLGVLDRLHGTDNMFRASKQYERHWLSLSLVNSANDKDEKTCVLLQTPLKQLIPDEDKKVDMRSESSIPSTSAQMAEM